MIMRGIEIADELVKKYNIDCDFQRKRHFAWTSSPDMVQQINQEYQLCQEIGIECKLLKGEEIGSELPMSLNPLLAIAFDNQAQFDSHSFCLGLAKEIQGDGCDVFENSRIMDVSLTSPHELQVESDVTVRAKQVVVATHLPILDRSLHFSILEPTRSLCVSARVKEEKAIPNMSVNVGQPQRSLRMYKDNVVVSGESFKNGEESQTQGKYDNLKAFLKEHFDVTDDDITYQWSAMDYFSQEHVPFIGELHPGATTLFTGTGFSKWGIAMSVAGAELIADKIDGKSSPFTEAVNAQRFNKNIASEFVQQNADSAKHLIGDKIKNLFEFNDISSIKMNQGGIIKHKGQNVGAFKDSNGKIHAVKPVCTHLGCDLVFNHGDNKWDCPCHASRFDVDGGVIHGPAVQPLERVDLD